MTERVTREIEYLRRLQHPHIIKLCVGGRLPLMLNAAGTR